MAIPNEGRNLHYLIARELLENHPETRIIVVSAPEQDDMSHPAFRYLADAGDIVQAPLLINHFYFLDAAFLPYRQMSYFVQSLFPSWFGMSRTFRKDYLGTSFDSTDSFRLPSGEFVNRYFVAPPQELNYESKQLFAKYGVEWHPRSRWEVLRNPLETEYTERLATLARQHCVELIFMHIPFYKSSPNMYDKTYYGSFGPLLDAQEFSDRANNYLDGQHVNRYGTNLMSQWLKSSINPYLGPLENQESCPAQVASLK